METRHRIDRTKFSASCDLDSSQKCINMKRSSSVYVFMKRKRVVKKKIVSALYLTSSFLLLVVLLVKLIVLSGNSVSQDSLTSFDESDRVLRRRTAMVVQSDDTNIAAASFQVATIGALRFPESV